MAISRHWRLWQANFDPGWCSNSPKWRFRDTGTFGRPNFLQGGVSIRGNCDFEALAHLAGQIFSRVVFQFAEIAISRLWRLWQANFHSGWCSNSRKLRFRDTGAFGRPNFLQGGVSIRQNGDFKTLALLAGQILAISRDWHSRQAYFVLVVCQFAKRTNSRNWHS